MKKIELSKETLRVLTSQETGAAADGAGDENTTIITSLTTTKALCA